MKKTYIMPQMAVVELMEEEMIAQSIGGGRIPISDEEENPENALTREEVTFPKHDVWNEW